MCTLRLQACGVGVGVELPLRDGTVGLIHDLLMGAITSAPLHAQGSAQRPMRAALNRCWLSSTCSTRRGSKSLRPPPAPALRGSTSPRSAGSEGDQGASQVTRTAMARGDEVGKIGFHMSTLHDPLGHPAVTGHNKHTTPRPCTRVERRDSRRTLPPSGHTLRCLLTRRSGGARTCAFVLMDRRPRSRSPS